jgi:hypothetical protein
MTRSENSCVSTNRGRRPSQPHLPRRPGLIRPAGLDGVLLLLIFGREFRMNSARSSVEACFMEATTFKTGRAPRRNCPGRCGMLTRPPRSRTRCWKTLKPAPSSSPWLSQTFPSSAAYPLWNVARRKMAPPRSRSPAILGRAKAVCQTNLEAGEKVSH